MVKNEYFRTPSTLLEELGISRPSEIEIEAIAFYCGAVVRYRPLTGCAARIVGKDHSAMITVDSSSSRARQRFSAAHELGHWMHDRGKAAFGCQELQLFNEWTRNNPEARANRYASDLLLPEALFEPAASAYQVMDFNTVRGLATTFCTSVTATAIRLVEHGPLPTMLVCYSAAGREWFVRGSVSGALWPPDSPPASTYAFDLLESQAPGEARGAVDASAWFDHPVSSGFYIEEHSIRTSYEHVLSLLWWKNEGMLINVDEYEDEGAVRSSDGRWDE